MKRTLITAGAMVLALGAGALGGHLLLPRDTAAAGTPAPAASTVSSTATHPVNRSEAYASYVAAYNPDNGCKADFDASYRGTMFVSDLPKGLRDDITEQWKTAAPGAPIADYFDGEVIGVIAHHDQVIFIGPATGLCK